MTSIFGNFTEEPMMQLSTLPSKPSGKHYRVLEYMNAYGIYCIRSGRVIARISKQWQSVGAQYRAAHQIVELLSVHCASEMHFPPYFESTDQRFVIDTNGPRVEVFDTRKSQPILVVSESLDFDIRLRTGQALAKLLNHFFEGPS